MNGASTTGRSTVLLLVLLAAGACGEEEVAEPSGPDFGELAADQVMVEVEHYLTREGVRRAHLTSDTVYLLDEGATARLRHFTVDFFGEQGERTSVLRAVDGLYDMRAGDMRARDDVRVVDERDSQRLRTEELIYDAATGKLRSDADFVLLRGRDTIRGTGFVTDPGLDSLQTRQPSMVSPPDGGREAGNAESGPEGEETASGEGEDPGAGDSVPGTAGADTTSPADTARSGGREGSLR